MKKILYLMSALAVVLGMTACSSDDIIGEEPTNVPDAEKLMTIVANTESSTTRASLSGDDETGYKVVWNEGDEITLVKSDGHGFSFTLTSGAGTTRGEFTGRSLEDGEYEAFYGGDNFLGETQYYFPNNVIRGAPMRAKVTIQNGVVSIANFKNLFGILRLDLTGSGRVKEVAIMTDQYISGAFTINGEGCAVVGNDASRNWKIVRLDFQDNRVSLEESKPIYITLPQGDYTGLKIWVTNGNGQVCYKSLKAGKTLNIERSQITPISLTCTEFHEYISTSARINDTSQSAYCYQLWEDGPFFANFNAGGSLVNAGPLYKYSNIPSWGNNFRLPTIDELHIIFHRSEFVEKKWKTVNGIYGLEVSGKGLYAINSVFFPASGIYNPAYGQDIGVGTKCGYWGADRWHYEVDASLGSRGQSAEGSEFKCSARYVLNR